MSTEASRFEAAFYAVLERNPDKPPGPTAINRELGKEHTSRTPLNTLNGRMSKVRKRLLVANGFVQDAKWGRWYKNPTVIKSYELGLICSCCGLKLANDDTSGCEYYSGCEYNHGDHVERLCQFGLEPNENPVVVNANETVSSFRCVGCGDDCMDYSFEVHVLYMAKGDA